MEYVLHAHEALGKSHGEFLGKTLMAREWAEIVKDHWPNQMIKAVGVILAESHGRIGAYNDNLRDSVIVSRDCGGYQINIPARMIGSDYEKSLRTESLDPAVYMTVARNNVNAMYSLWATKGVFRNGKLDYRRWQPSVAYTSGWVPFPRLYAWHHDKEGNPVGPWVVSGRYLHNAIRGVANWHLVISKDQGMTSQEALAWTNLQAQHFGIADAECEWRYSDKKLIYYVPGPMPTKPPTEEENWGYPVHNDGR